jgi:hypothetical protein
LRREEGGKKEKKHTGPNLDGVRTLLDGLLIKLNIHYVLHPLERDKSDFKILVSGVPHEGRDDASVISGDDGLEGDGLGADAGGRE